VNEKLIVALDFAAGIEALAFVERLGDAVERYKVGLELFTAEGPPIVEKLRALGKRVFVDLKLHDIPETVGRAAASIGKLGADLMTVHAGGGVEMMRRAVEAAPDTRVLAVTVLTSLDVSDLRTDGISADSTGEQVLRRAQLADQAGCAGVIASPLELKALRARTGRRLMIVTPGVRPWAMNPAGAASDDQKRVATAKEAVAGGADAVVVGRPIRDAQDPVEAAQRILQDLV
jgi:orotidine-5'-phosphate decarboxylase